MSGQHQPKQQRREIVTSPELPLAVYREVAAHLRQVEGIETGLIPQQSFQFSYRQSQVGGLWIQYSEHLEPNCQERVEQILAYYAERFGDWQRQA
ncbi:MAG: hypothetical protein ACFB4I_05155 [Cyanophyceae cyanobacterium]